MQHSLVSLIRNSGIALVQRFGSKVVDERTGCLLGRALFIPWRGRVLVVGLDAPVRPVFRKQSRLTYWRQELGFATHPEPDFPHDLPGS